MTSVSCWGSRSSSAFLGFSYGCAAEAQFLCINVNNLSYARNVRVAGKFVFPAKVVCSLRLANITFSKQNVTNRGPVRHGEDIIFLVHDIRKTNGKRI